ncbi:M48 family metallopeptidase [Marinicella rhabdoformis]|uniref:M48 metallopeptidase family protein n=1 Tax=Marinicella rhabdoformis TaxID=2580566 RepID=UPI0012AEDB0A|nr:M48 family metallopeptidase [Marinicella rhabdoformis]
MNHQAKLNCQINMPMLCSDFNPHNSQKIKNQLVTIPLMPVNTETGSIRLNLELAKKPLDCQEYLFVHELIPLHERNHNERFKKILNDLMPDWKSRRDLLNRSPLAHEDWEY